jgi:flavin reductase (DIM6/NTAB) family NADH-FMN oxidoreductase RutF
LHDIQELGSVPQSLVFVEVKAVYVDDAAASTDAKGRVNILAEKIKPLARLGAGQYLSAGEILERERPL